MTVEKFKEGEVYFSSATGIAYKIKRGVLYKFPTYAGAHCVWAKSGYSGEHGHFKKLSKDEIKEKGIE